jgi:hypothetical protein
VTEDDIAEFNDTWTLETPEWMTNLWASLSVSITMPGTWFIMSLLILGMCERFGAGNDKCYFFLFFLSSLQKLMCLHPLNVIHISACSFFFLMTDWGWKSLV